MIYELPIFSTLVDARRHLRDWLRDHPDVHSEYGTLQTLVLEDRKTGYRFRFEVADATEIPDAQ